MNITGKKVKHIPTGCICNVLDVPVSVVTKIHHSKITGNPFQMKYHFVTIRSRLGIARVCVETELEV